MAINAGMPKNPDGWCVPQRYILAFMGFLAIANGYIQRFCLSLAITEMVAPHHSHHTPSGPNLADPNACPYESTNAKVIGYHRVSAEQLEWSETMQGAVLSAVFWGYVLTQLPGGLLAERVGGKQVLGVGLLVSTLGTLLTPTFARMGAYWMVGLRFVIGLGQGPMYPSLNVMLAQWAPPHERGRMGAAVFAGAQIGNVVAMAAGGLLMRYMEGGWVNVFYVFGAAGLVWVALWEVLCYSEPDSHPFISDAEKQYLITHSVGQIKRRQDLPPTPWRHILSSTPLWGLIIAQVGHDWGLFTIITDLPKYMKNVMHFSIAQNGLLSAAPYLVMWIFALVSGAIVDFLVKKQFSITLVRKIFISIAASGPAVGILAASYSGCDKVLVSVFFTAGMGLMGAFVPSLKVNALDLSPNYAGTLMALVGGIGAISGIIAPYLVGLLTTNISNQASDLSKTTALLKDTDDIRRSTLLEWRLVFWIAVVILVSTNVVYLVMGSAEVQPWNDTAPVDRRPGSQSDRGVRATIVPTAKAKEAEAVESQP